MVKRSAIICPLILRSSGLSVLREGERLTSSSQGRSRLSSRMSKPSTSKQLVRQGTVISIAPKTVFSMLSTDLMMRSSMRAQAAGTSWPSWRRCSRRAKCDHLWPLHSSWSSLGSKLSANLLREQLVRCAKRLSLEVRSKEQGAVARRVRPSSQTQMRRGFQQVTATQTRMSNLRPLARSGLWMYSLTTMHSFCFCRISSCELDSQMPLPCELLCGFTMYHRSSFCRSALSAKMLASAGRMNVCGKNPYSRGNRCFIFDRFCSIRSLRVSSKLFGKWLIFWQAPSDWYTADPITPMFHTISPSCPKPSTNPFSSSRCFISPATPFVKRYLQPRSQSSMSRWLPDQFLKIRQRTPVRSTASEDEGSRAPWACFFSSCALSSRFLLRCSSFASFLRSIFSMRAEQSALKSQSSSMLPTASASPASSLGLLGCGLCSCLGTPLLLRISIMPSNPYNSIFKLSWLILSPTPARTRRPSRNSPCPPPSGTGSSTAPRSSPEPPAGTGTTGPRLPKRSRSARTAAPSRRSPPSPAAPTTRSRTSRSTCA